MKKISFFKKFCKFVTFLLRCTEDNYYILISELCDATVLLLPPPLASFSVCISRPSSVPCWWNLFASEYDAFAKPGFNQYTWTRAFFLMESDSVSESPTFLVFIFAHTNFTSVEYTILRRKCSMCSILSPAWRFCFPLYVKIRTKKI
jgi:hypothetical protein